MNDRNQDGESLSVFIPGLMGAGILASAVVLIGDLLRFLLPDTGTRRARRIARSAHGLIASTVQPAGIELVAWKRETRVPRNRMTYLILVVWMGVLIVAALEEATEEFGRAGGLLYHNPWPLIIGITVAVLAGLVGAIGLALAGATTRTPSWLQWLVGNTWLGKSTIAGELVLEAKPAR